MADNFAIVNLKDGLRRDLESFLIENDSFPTLENAYLFRGRIKRRSCFSAIGSDGRLKLEVGTTDGFGNITLLDGTFGAGIPTGIATFEINGDTLTDPGGASPVVLLTTGVTIGTLDRATGVLQTNAALAPVIYIPGRPVMGLRVLEQNITSVSQNAINDELLIAFDTRWSYIFDNGTNDYIGISTHKTTGNQFIWEGTDSAQFWTTNYYNAFWATNNIPGLHAAQTASPVAEGDGIRWYDGPNPAAPATGWVNFNPQLDATNFLQGGLIVLPYKDRLLVLNTLEGINLAGVQRFPQRARWSQNGTPFYGLFPTGGSAQINAWRSDVVGRGGFIDAPTAEVIVSAEFIKDTLVVYFERSTWQLVYTQNEFFPFIWQKINTELGTESTFSIVPFDRGVFGVGNYGIITTDSVNVVRLDQKIPDEVFQIQNTNDGVKRVSGVRDYNAQLVYWAFPTRLDEDGDSVNYDLTFPNQVLVYNYLENSWAEFDDSFTCFGYWQKFTDTTWAQTLKPWNIMSVSWISGVLQSRYPDVVAGNQRGFTMVYSQQQNLGQNTPSIPISDITPATRRITAPNHNFVVNDYLLLTGILGITSGNSSGTPNNIIYKVVGVPTTSTFQLDQIDPTDIWAGTYTGGGLLTHIPNINITTKEFNPYFTKGISFRVNYFDIYLNNTDEGQFSAQFLTDDNTSTPIGDVVYGSPFTQEVIIRTTPEPMPTYETPSPSTNWGLAQNKIWHRVYTNAFGSFIQNKFILDDSQMRDLNIASSDITIHGLIYYISPAGRLSYDI